VSRRRQWRCGSCRRFRKRNSNLTGSASGIVDAATARASRRLHPLTRLGKPAGSRGPGCHSRSG
jgi:hypothetical protein